MRQRLDNDGELVVELRDLTQRGGIFGILSHCDHFGVQRIFDCDADVVDGGLRRDLVGGIDADGVGEFDWVQRK